MTDITVFNSKFETSGKLKTDVSLTPEDINMPVVHQVVKATLAGRRQGTAATKTRAMVAGGGCKPFKQKGTGRARQGSIRAIQHIGGGVAFGPQPRDYTQKVNKKVQLKAIQAVLADKFQAGKLHVIDGLAADGKTKTMFALLNGKGLLPALVVTDKKDSPALKAARNLKRGDSLPVDSFNVYEAVKFENLVIEKEALERLLKRLG